VAEYVSGALIAQIRHERFILDDYKALKVINRGA